MDSLVGVGLVMLVLLMVGGVSVLIGLRRKSGISLLNKQVEGTFRAMMSMINSDTLAENIALHLEAIDLCLLHQLRMPALILIYSGIDIFASLGRPRDKQNSTRSDYIGWCKKYMLPGSDLSCSAIDLYAARCSVVHTYTMSSTLSEERKAVEIIYSWGNQSPDPLQKLVDRTSKSARVIHIDSLAASFRRGVAQFVEDARNDREWTELIVSRARKMFKNQGKGILTG